SANVDLNEWGLFFTRHGGGLHATLVGSGGTSGYDVRRGSLGAGQQGEYGGSFANVYGEVGAEYSAPWLTLRPFAGLGYTSLHADGLTEEGALLNLAVSDASIDSLRSMVGLDTSWLLSHRNSLALDLRAMWMHDLLFGGVPHVHTGLAGLTGNAAIAGADIGRDFALLGTGLSMDLVPRRARLSGQYDVVTNHY